MGHGGILDHRCAPFPFCPPCPIPSSLCRLCRETHISTREVCTQNGSHIHASRVPTAAPHQNKFAQDGCRFEPEHNAQMARNLICLSSGIQTDRDASPTIKQGGLRIVPQPGRHSSVRSGRSQNTVLYLMYTANPDAGEFQQKDN